MECPSCRAEMPEGRRFCTACGAPVFVLCPSCQRPNAPGARFCGDCGAGLGLAGTQPEAVPPSTISSAERRQLTVMFGDLVGSTALAARLDPEDLRDLIGLYHRCVAETVGRFGGFVAKYMGDGALLYFGYPRAHEDDAERAARAGLALVDAVGQLQTSEPLQVRIGIETGLVIVGDLIGTGAAQERGIIGETPNLAARLQALAEPDAVVIGPTMHRLLGELFEYHNLGAVDVKGLAAPVQAWQVLRPSVVESRFEALHAATLTPFVGRVEEIELFRQRWERAKGGAGQVVLLSGEPGIGKSRLIAAVQDRLRDSPHTRLRCFCAPHRQDSALHPTISHLEHAAGFTRDDSAAAKFDKLAALLAHTGATAEDVAVLAELLSLPAADADAAVLRLSPQQKKERTFATLVRQLETLARQSPVLFLFEDAHWVDPSSLELLNLIVARTEHFPVLLVITFRPEFQPPWVGAPHVTALRLHRLGPREAAGLVVHVLGDKASSLPSKLVGALIDHTDGVPLFLEELTKSVLESGAADMVIGDAARAPRVELAIPTTLQALLMARLDRLGTAAKAIGQIGAALGREFSHELIRAVALTTDGILDEQLERLVAAGLLFRRGTPPGATYTFKHALVLDAAYGTLVRGDRQRLHARIAEAMEESFPERARLEPELLAHHFAEAHQAERALAYWLKAGERAAARSANLEAIRHFGRALEALHAVPEGAERDRQELALQIAIGTPLIAVHGYSASQTGAAYGRARVLCERLGEAEPLVATLSGEFVHYFVRGDFPMMRRLTEEARQVSERLPNPLVRLASHRLAGITAMHCGAFYEARSDFESILSLYDESRHRSQPVHYVHDPKVSALTYLALVLWILGLPEQALRTSLAAFRCAAELDQANLTAHVHNFAGAGLAELLGNVSAVQLHAEAIITLAEQHSLQYWRMNGLILRGWAMTQRGAAAEGIALMRRNADDRAALGVSWFHARYLCMLAVAHAQIGEPELGLSVIAEARNLVDRSDEHMWEAEIDRIEGELRRMQGAAVAVVEACFTRALARARDQSAKSLELRAATGLARLWRDHGRCREAHDLLAPVHGWFTEGFATRDLADAKALLDDLRR